MRNPTIPPPVYVMGLTSILHLILLRHPNSQRTPIPLFYKTEPGQSQNIYATARKTTQDIIYDLGLKSKKSLEFSPVPPPIANGTILICHGLGLDFSCYCPQQHCIFQSI